jgi:hypothetical protein
VPCVVRGSLSGGDARSKRWSSFTHPGASAGAIIVLFGLGRPVEYYLKAPAFSEAMEHPANADFPTVLTMGGNPTTRSSKK